jgi:hypothetical protein
MLPRLTSGPRGYPSGMADWPEGLKAIIGSAKTNRGTQVEVHRKSSDAVELRAWADDGRGVITWAFPLDQAERLGLIVTSAATMLAWVEQERGHDEGPPASYGDEPLTSAETKERRSPSWPWRSLPSGR